MPTLPSTQHRGRGEAYEGKREEDGPEVGRYAETAFCLLLFDQTPPLFLNTALGGLNDEQLNALL